MSERDVNGDVTPPQPTPLSNDEIAAESGIPLPDKEVVSLLDLNADLDLALDVAAPIDLAVAANANVAAPIDAAVGANVLSEGSTAQAVADQGTLINQGITGAAVANATQDSSIAQSASPDAAPTPDGDANVAVPTTPSSVLDGDLLNVDVKLNADANLSAPVGGAVAANANVAAPIDAAVGANVASVGSQATAVAQQDAIINQQIDATASATVDQKSDISQ
jgi:hypothetical protein